MEESKRYIDKEATLKAMKAWRAGSVGFHWKCYTDMIHIVEGMEEVDPDGELLIFRAKMEEEKR